MQIFNTSFMKVCQARAYCLSLFEQFNVLDIFNYRMLDDKNISFKFFYNFFILYAFSEQPSICS